METTNNEITWTQVAEIELVYRTKVKPSQRPKVQTSEQTYQLLRQVWNHDLIELQEEFKVLFLNRRNSVLGLYEASKEE